MNIDVILYKFFPNDVRPRKEAILLASEGHKIRIFCLRGPGEKAKEVHNENILVHRILDATEDSRIGISSIILFWLAVIRCCSKRNGSTAVHCHDLSALPAGFIVSLLNKSWLIYDAHELFPEVARTRIGILSYLLFVTLEIICCIRVTAMIGVSKPQINILSHRCRCPSFSVHNYPSLSEIDYSYHVKRTRNVVFGMSGYIYETRGHYEVMEALELMAKEGLNLEFWIVGDGPKANRLKQKAENLSYPCKFFGYIDSREKMFSIVAEFDYAIVANHPSRNYLVTSINRSYEYAALGVPFICPHYAGISDIVLALNLPHFNPLNPYSIKRAIESLMNRSRKELSHEGRRLIEKRFNWEYTSRKIRYLYKHLDSKRIHD